MQAIGRYTVPPVLLVLFILLCTPALASTTGKIAGIVTDAETGEPLQGATIKVQATQVLSEADSDGEFYIINLPVGVYSIVVSMVGYETVTVQEIRVLMDLTTPLELSMRRSTIDLQKSVTVVAKRPLIQRDKTSSGEIITRDEIAYVANSQNVLSIISNMGGTVVDGDGGLHVRGGRSGSVKYYYDGFSVHDPFGNNMAIRIAPDAVEELSLTSGGLAPEYGEALSGIVNAITREGSNRYSGRIKYFEGASHRYDENTGTFGGLERTENRSVLFDLSGPLLAIDDRISTFYANCEFIRDDGYLPHNRKKTYSTSAKVVTFPASNFKMVANGSYYFRDVQRYVHRDNNNKSYDFNLDGLGKYEDESYLVGLQGSYNKSQTTVITLKANRFRTKTKLAPEHIFDLHWSEWPGYSVDENGIYNGTIDDSNYNVSPDYAYIGFTSGEDFWPYYLEKFSAYNGFGLSFLSQLDHLRV